MIDNHNGGGGFLKTLVEYKDYFAFVMLAIWGGVASYLTKLQKNKTPFTLADFITSGFVVSGFVGAITILFCISRQYAPTVTGAMVGISGYMSTEIILLAKRFLKERAKRIIGDEANN